MSNSKPTNLIFVPTGGLIGAVVGGMSMGKIYSMDRLYRQAGSRSPSVSSLDSVYC